MLKKQLIFKNYLIFKKHLTKFVILFSTGLLAISCTNKPNVTSLQSASISNIAVKTDRVVVIVPDKIQAKLNPNGYSQVGMASWYGKECHGKHTAHGVKYNKRSLTAAHPTLPLPSKVKVTNLTNGKSVVLTIDDRGPFSKKRIIDVSERAAEILDMKISGIAKVKVELLSVNDLPSVKKVKLPVNQKKLQQKKPLEYIQIGEFNSKLKATRAMNNLSKIAKVEIKQVAINQYRVRVGPIQNKQQANKLLAKVKNLHYIDAVILPQHKV